MRAFSTRPPTDTLRMARAVAGVRPGPDRPSAETRTPDPTGPARFPAIRTAPSRPALRPPVAAEPTPVTDPPTVTPAIEPSWKARTLPDQRPPPPRRSPRMVTGPTRPVSAVTAPLDWPLPPTTDPPTVTPARLPCA